MSWVSQKVDGDVKRECAIWAQRASFPRFVLKRHLRILFLEDDAVDFELIVQEFEKAKFEITPCLVECKDEFMRCLSSQRFDAVIADYHLPTWTGMDALQLMREQGYETPFILVTGARLVMKLRPIA